MKKLFILSTLLLTLLTSCHTNVIDKTSLRLSDTLKTNVDSFSVMNLSSINLYSKHCKMCHGQFGKGDGIKARTDKTICPYDLTQISKPDKDLYYIILEGENKMPSQKELKKEDINLLLFYIKGLKNIDTSKYYIDTVKVVEMKNLQSSSLYDLNCKMCHGNFGTGDGVKARHDTTICPYDLSKETKTDKDIYYIILKGDNNMPGHQLKEQEVWLIVFYIKKFK